MSVHARLRSCRRDTVDGLQKICVGNHIATLVILASAAWMLPQRADAFNVFDVQQNGIARWNSDPHSVGGIERSLDGGLRYSLQGGSYEAFRDLIQWEDAPPSVADFQVAVEGAFASWEKVDPATLLGTELRFVPDLETQVAGEPIVDDLVDRFQLNPGAEIDLIIDDLCCARAFTNPFFDPNTDTVTLTSGVGDYPAAVMSGVDIYLSRGITWDLTEFQSTLAHQIGLALGLGQVDIGKGAYDVFTDYYDDNFDGTSRDTARATLTNSFADVIDPLDPNNSPGLTLFDVCGAVDGDPFNCLSDPGVKTPGVNLLMESFSPQLPRDFLQNDEFAGRQFLYPFVREPGDFNADKSLTVEDIDLLSAEIRKDEPRPWFDLTEDEIVDQADRTFWVHELKNTWFGDSNLDGEFNSGDLTLVFQAGQYQDGVDQDSTWATGDWDGNGEFDSGDLVLAFQDSGYDMGPRAVTNTVPEPASVVLLLMSLMAFATRRRASSLTIHRT